MVLRDVEDALVDVEVLLLDVEVLLLDVEFLLDVDDVPVEQRRVWWYCWRMY